MRHLTVAVLVVIVVNTQLTWWIIYTLRENRTRLELERAAMLSTCRLAAARVALAMDRARDAALESLLTANGSIPEEAPAPFRTMSLRQGSRCGTGWVLLGGSLQLWIDSPAGCVVAAPYETWIKRILTPPKGFVRGSARTVNIPGAVLAKPFDDWAFRPDEARWNAVLSQYRRRITMVVSEGSFFALLIFVMLGLLWKTLRREVELERQHQNFLSAITHELKSPLASIRLTLETLMRGRADQEASLHFLANALQDTERLQSLVQKVLEVTRYGSGSHALELRRNDLSALVEETIVRFQRRATAAGAGLHADIAPGIVAEVDEEAFPIIVSNLLENAVKYGGTPPQIRVSLSLEEGHAVLRVADNGGGIAPDDIALVFDRFFRSGDEMTRTTEGTGLGLYLVRQIAAAHGASVQVESSGPEGTVFAVVIPHAGPTEEAA